MRDFLKNPACLDKREVCVYIIMEMNRLYSNHCFLITPLS